MRFRPGTGLRGLQFRETLAQVGLFTLMNWILRYLTPSLLCSLLVGCGVGLPLTPQQRLDQAIKKLAAAKTQEDKFYALNDAAKETFVVGKVEDARKYAEELMALLPNFPGDWDYGNAVQDANLVLGRIAVQNGHIDEAKRHLIAAGNSPGSP